MKNAANESYEHKPGSGDLNADAELLRRLGARREGGPSGLTAQALADANDADLEGLVKPRGSSPLIRPPGATSPEAFPLGAYDPLTRQFAAGTDPAGRREASAAAAMARQPEGGVEYSDYEGAGGWGYRLFGDGTLKIIKAPEGYKAGAKLDGGAAYDAIWREIGSKAPSFSTPGGPKAGGIHEAGPAPGVGSLAGAGASYEGA